MRLRVGALLIITSAWLAGCGGSEGEPSGDTSSEPTTTQTSDETAGGDTECLLGRWYLDTDDYAAQAMAYVVGLGVPMESLTITGDQILDFNENPRMNIATSLQLNAVVQGHAVAVSSQSAGGGDWGWNAGSTSAIGVDDWEWTAAPSASPDGAPPLLDPSNGISVTCSTDRLTVQGSGAPLTGVFVRR